MKSIKLYESLNKVRNLTEEVFEVVCDSFFKNIAATLTYSDTMNKKIETASE